MKIVIFSFLFVSISGNDLNNKNHKNTLGIPLYNTFDRVMRWLECQHRENQRKQIHKNKPFILYN